LATNRVSLELEKVKNRINRIDQASKNEVKIQGLKLDTLEKGLKKGVETFLRKQQEILQNQENLLRQLDPESILKRGYTRTELGGKPIQLAQPKTGDQIQTFTLEQKISSTITQVEEK
jgi:exodeoxyribonuclease VII large subunit